MTIADFFLVASIYLVGIASPGPATIAIAATSLAHGRRTGLTLALGVVTGSIMWSIVAAFGFGALMMTHSWILEGLKVAGGAYLLWLGYKSVRSALRPNTALPTPRTVGDVRAINAYFKGLAIHMTNPKAVLFWGALFSMVVEPGHSPLSLVMLLVMTSALGVMCFCGYAIIFSTERAMTIYVKARRRIEAIFGLVFGALGITLLTTRLT